MKFCPKCIEDKPCMNGPICKHCGAELQNICSKCHINEVRPQGGKCRSCEAEATRNYWLEHKKPRPQSVRKTSTEEATLRHRAWQCKQYGVDFIDVLEQIEKQDSRCSICGKQSKLVIDHNHKTGFYRGLLCSSCNMALGAFDDNVELLSNAIEYVRRDDGF